MGSVVVRAPLIGYERLGGATSTFMIVAHAPRRNFLAQISESINSFNCI